MKKLTCEVAGCEQTFKGPQGLGSHLSWHEQQGDDVPSRKKVTRNSKRRIIDSKRIIRPKRRRVDIMSLDEFKQQLYIALAEFPNGGAIKNIALKMKKNGYKSRTQTREIAKKISTSVKNFPEVERMGRGVIRLSQTGIERSLISVKPQIPTASTIEIPKEALHLQIEHLQGDLNRTKRALMALIPGD